MLTELSVVESYNFDLVQAADSVCGRHEERKRSSLVVVAVAVLVAVDSRTRNVPEV